MSTPSRNETIVKRDSQIHSCTATQYRYTLHVPEQYNNGDAVPQRFIDSLEAKLVDMFGAFTRQVGVSGMWHSNGVTYADPQTLYYLDCVSSQCGNQLRELAAAVRDDLLQESIYVTCQQITTWLV